MTKSEIEKEASALKAKLDEIEERAKMELATSKFLCIQADKLVAEANLPSTSWERREQISKEMEALQARMLFEAKHVHDDDTTMQCIFQRITELHAMWHKQNE